MPIQKLSTFCHVNLGIFPSVETTSLNPDVDTTINAGVDMLRQRKSPAKSQRKVVRKDQLLVEGVYTIGVCSEKKVCVSLA